MAKSAGSPLLTLVNPASTPSSPRRGLGAHGMGLWNRIQAEYRIEDTGGINSPVCGKRATLLGNADESRRMTGTGQAAGMLSGQLFGPGGQDHSRVIGSTGGQYGPLEGATAEKAVPFPCAARRSLDLRGRQQVAFVVALPHAAEPSPSRASLNGLDAINFFNAAMLAGFGPYVAVYLAEQKWTQENIGFVLTA